MIERIVGEEKFSSLEHAALNSSLVILLRGRMLGDMVVINIIRRDVVIRGNIAIEEISW